MAQFIFTTVLIIHIIHTHACILLPTKILTFNEVLYLVFERNILTIYKLLDTCLHLPKASTKKPKFNNISMHNLLENRILYTKKQCTQTHWLKTVGLNRQHFICANKKKIKTIFPRLPNIQYKFTAASANKAKTYKHELCISAEKMLRTIG